MRGGRCVTCDATFFGAVKMAESPCFALEVAGVAWERLLPLRDSAGQMLTTLNPGFLSSVYKLHGLPVSLHYKSPWRGWVVE